MFQGWQNHLRQNCPRAKSPLYEAAVVAKLVLSAGRKAMTMPEARASSQERGILYSARLGVGLERSSSTGATMHAA